jgi:hypothetical protein
MSSLEDGRKTGGFKMSRLDRRLLYVTGCVVALSFPLSGIAQDSQSSAAEATKQAANSGTGSAARLSSAATRTSAELPDSPGTTQQTAQNSQPGNPTQPSSSQPSSLQEQKQERPVGTAAAEATKVSGITAAEPAGIAIAPAKQRRTRTLVLKVGAIIGVGVAVGTVVALSAGTSSKPPGAR